MKQETMIQQKCVLIRVVPMNCGEGTWRMGSQDVTQVVNWPTVIVFVPKTWGC